MTADRVRSAVMSGMLAVFLGSALLATGAPGWIRALATVAGVIVIWRYTGAFAFFRADWEEAKAKERERRASERDPE